MSKPDAWMCWILYGCCPAQSGKQTEMLCSPCTKHGMQFRKELVYWAAENCTIKGCNTSCLSHTSPVQSLYAEANEPSLNRRIKLAMQYVVKLKTSTLNPALNCQFKTRDESTYEAMANYIRPLRQGIQPHLEWFTELRKFGTHPLKY